MNNFLSNIRTSIDDYFADVNRSPSLQYRVLAQTRGEMKVKKRLSVGFVLIILLMLTVITALAMTMTAYYEKAIELESESGPIQEWSPSDKVALVHWMLEAGIPLDEGQVAKLDNGMLSEAQQDELAMHIVLSYYPVRDKMLTTVDIIEKEYGEYEEWPLELRAWYSMTLEKSQHEQSNSAFAKNILPEEKDISEEQAKALANQCLTEVLGLSPLQIESLEAKVFFQEDTGSEEPNRIWYFNYYEKENKELKFYVYIKSDGTLLDCGCIDEPVTSASELNNKFYDLIAYHSKDFFTVEGLAEFSRSLAPQIRQAMSNGGIDKWPAYFSQIPYALPDSAAITADRALEIGTQAILEQYGWTAMQLEEKYVFTLSYRIYEDVHEWRVAYRIPAEGKPNAFLQFRAGEIPFCIIVRIDPFSSSIMSVIEENDVDEYWYGE